jgi:hypothetical protein
LQLSIPRCLKTYTFSQNVAKYSNSMGCKTHLVPFGEQKDSNLGYSLKYSSICEVVHSRVCCLHCLNKSILTNTWIVEAIQSSPRLSMLQMYHILKVYLHTYI